MRPRGSISALLLAVCIGSTAADEGMWMPQQIPMLGEELKELGLQLDPAAFADLTSFPMGAIVSLGGCSASFVSPDGLMVTNHHCVFSALQYNSTAENDLLAEGFLARTKDEELQATPDAQLFVTTEIEDVTTEIAGNIEEGLSDLERAKLIEQRRKDMIKSCENEQDDVRCQVSSFFGGEMFLKITSMKLRDVRLVYAPALGIGNFGDEADNWMWPRHTGDFGFLRAYVGADGKPADYSPDNVPYRPKYHFKISTRDLDPKDLTLLAGFPGTTSRLVTAEEVRHAQEQSMPTSIRYRKVLLKILHEMGSDDRSVQILNASRISSLENYLKKYTGVLAAFDRDDLLAKKLEAERQLQQYFDRNPEMAAEYAAIRKEFLGVLAEDWSTFERDALYAWLFIASPMLSEAKKIHRTAEERDKPDSKREEGFQERDWPRLRNRIERTQRTIHVESDRAGLQWFLLEATRLPSDQRITAVDEALAATGEESVEAQVGALLDQLYDGTDVADLDTRLQMFEESKTELMAHDDAMIALAAKLRPLGKEIEDRERALEGAEYRLRPHLIAAMRELRDGRLAPDANSTLRVTFGQVRGYQPRDGVVYEPQTTIAGVLEKETGERPFDSPPRLLHLAGEGQFGPYADPDLGTIAVGFVSTTNVTNGSSGSAALNAWGEICGLAFDMNWEGVAADWVVNEDYVRTIHVDSRYMLWVMDAVDGAHNLLEEMGLPIHFPKDAR